MGWRGVATATPGQQDAIFLPPLRIFLQFLIVFLLLYLCSQTGWRQEISDRGADSSDEGAKIRLSGYCKYQKSPKKSLSTFRRGG